MPKPYIVPGGRFGEIYYWDSYFTMLGLRTAGKEGMIENMLDNFAYLIDTHGFIPNGNRAYYLGRSQPPFFSAMVRLLAEEKGEEILEKYREAMQKEYAFWMAGREKLSPEQPAYRRVVRMEDGSVLNRYYDDRPEPRPESYKEDVALARESGREASQLYRDIRAACESGWDFSSRWFGDGNYLKTIHTTEIIPVDLNALLYHMETMLSDAYALSDSTIAKTYQEKADDRKEALQKYCWDERVQFFVDYDFVMRKPTGILSLAAVYPLYFELAEEQQAFEVADKLRKEFLKEGGGTYYSC